jgi:hypothetical protein
MPPYSVTAELELLRWVKLNFETQLQSYATTMEEDEQLMRSEAYYPKLLVI